MANDFKYIQITAMTAEEILKCPYCGSTNIGAWGPNADKYFDCTMTWTV